MPIGSGICAGRRLAEGVVGGEPALLHRVAASAGKPMTSPTA